ncbi:MAG: HPr kinase/phosphorylase [Tsuneonella sp.]
MAQSLYQATAVSIGDRALLLSGPPGCGKSSLALALIDRGASLVGDDGVALEIREGRVWAGPPDATRGLIEVRGVGIISLAAVSAPVALVLRAHSDPPRFVDSVGSVDLAGLTVPALAFDFVSPFAHLRAEHALALYGLPDSGPMGGPA